MWWWWKVGGGRGGGVPGGQILFERLRNIEWRVSGGRSLPEFED